MVNLRWLLAIPVALGAMLISVPADASSIRDSAKMFSPAAARKAQARLDSLERTTHIPVVIETVSEITGLDADATNAAKRKAIDALAVHRDERIHADGVYLLIAKRERLISHVLVRERYADLLPIEKRDAIREAFLEEFHNKNFDGGLTRAVETIERSLHGAFGAGRAERAPAAVPVPLQHGGAGRKAASGGSTMGTFLLIVAGIFGVLLLLRVLGGLFGRSARPGMPGGMGMGRPGMGGPGYYGGGYGGGGGFMSSLFGGLGGALAGNWLYDQFSGRHGHVTSADAVSPGDYSSGAPDAGGDAIVGADDDAGGGASWDDAGGGGGDWGGGDAGGGDWGGGGGDWGGGGGDWGGGGDFGGGGGDW
jgi:uncharacterized protein